jgi:hypothetical protein
MGAEIELRKQSFENGGHSQFRNFPARGRSRAKNHNPAIYAL